VANVSCNSGAVGDTINWFLGTKRYQFTLTGTAATNYSIDLCIPRNATGTADRTDSSWAFPGDYYGVQAVNLMAFAGIGNTKQITVNTVSLKRIGSTFQGVILPVQPHPAPYSTTIENWYITGSDGTRRARLMWAYADGKQALDLPHAVRTTGAPDNAILPGERLSLTEWGSIANGTPSQTGFAAGTPVGSVNAYYNGNLYAAYLTDTKYEVTGRVRNYLTDFSSTALQVIPQYTNISVYPGITNPGSLGGSVFPLRSTKRVHGYVHGLVVDPSTGNSVSGTIVLVSGGASPNENMTTDANGFYVAGTPRAVGPQTVSYGANSQARTLLTRKWTYTGFAGSAGTTADTWVSYDVSPSGRQIMAYLSAGTILLQRATDAQPNLWELCGTLTAGTQPYIRYDRHSNTNRLYADYVASGAVRIGFTEDEGQTFTTMQTLAASGGRPAFIISRDGTGRHFWRTSGSAIQGVILDSLGGTIVSTFTAVASGVDDDAIDVDEYVLDGGDRWLALLYRTGGALVTVKSSDGTAFT
jgi:hypothetical protein